MPVSREEVDLGLPGTPLDLVVDAERQQVLLPEGRRVCLADQPVLFAMLKILVKETGRMMTRSQVYYELWRTSYDPEIHDQKVVKTLQRLRAALGTWHDGRPLLHLAVETGVGLRRDLAAGILLTRHEVLEDNLRPRARLILAALAPGIELGINDLQVACREGHSAVVAEVALLVRVGLVRRTGKARATRYHRVRIRPGGL